MSGSIATIPLTGVPLNPWTGMKDYNSAIASQYQPAQAEATVGLTGAQTKEAGARAQLAHEQAILAHQQAIGAGVTAQQGLLRLGMMQQALNPGGDNTSYGGSAGLPWGEAAPAGTPAIGAPAGGAPSAAGGAPAIGGGGAAPAIGGGVPAATGMYASTAQPAGQPSAPPAGMGPVFTGPGGTINPLVGVPVPRSWMAGFAQAQDWQKARDEMIASRKAILGQMIGQTVGQNGQVDRSLWNQSVQRAFQEGYITNQDAWAFYDHPERAQNALGGLVSPGEQPMMRQEQSRATAAGTGAGGSPYELVDVPVPGPNGTVVQQKMTRAQALQYANGGGGGVGGGGATGATTLTPGEAPMSGATYADAVKGRENPGGNPAQRNASGPGGTPTSSAMGDHQFTDDTWLAEMKRYRPDLTNGQTDAQILAMRSIPRLSAEMTQRYGIENSDVLRKAGMPVNAATIGLAHAFGPSGAVDLMKAPANAPLSQVFPPSVVNGQQVPNPVLRANPTYANQTVEQVLGGFKNRFGLGPVNFDNVSGGGSAPQTGIGQGVPSLTQQQQNRVTENNRQLGEDSSDLDKILALSQVANGAKPVLYDIKRLVPGSITGSLAGARTAFANFMATFGGKWSDEFLKDTVGLDKASTQNTQELIKQLTKNVTNAEAQMGQGQGSVRFGAMLTQFLARANPNIEMQGHPITDMTNWLLVMNQMIQDYAGGAQRHYRAARDSYLADDVANPYAPLSNYHGAWLQPNSPNNPATYEAAALAMTGKPFTQWSKGLSNAQIDQVGGIIARADPVDGGLTTSNGRWVTSQQLSAGNAAPAPMPGVGGQ